MSLQLSSERRVRFLLYRWPREGDTGLLAIVQYDFTGENHAGCCWSIGIVAHLVRSKATWQVRDQYLLETWQHTTVESVRFLDDDTLLVESDLGGAATAIIEVTGFDLRYGRLDEILDTYSYLEHDLAVDDTDHSAHYDQKLDLSRTAQTHGREFCFVKTLSMQDDKWLVPPRVTRPCYKRGDGVDAEDSRKRNGLLKPLTSAP